MTGGTINLQLTQEEKYARMEYVFLKDAIHHVVQDWDAMQIEYVFLFPAQWMNNVEEGYLQIYVTEAIFIVKCLEMLIEGVKPNPSWPNYPFCIVPTFPKLNKICLPFFKIISNFQCHKVIMGKFPFLPIMIGKRH